MTLQEAIELIKMLQINLASEMDADDLNALQLGIEALKLVDNLRFDGSPYYPKLLSGETQDWANG